MTKELLNLLQHAAADVRPREQLKHLLKNCLAVTQASAARLYTLTLADFTFSLVAQINHPEALSNVSATVLNESARISESIVHRVIGDNHPVRLGEISSDSHRFLASPRARSRLLIPIHRSKPCIGFIDLESNAVEHFTSVHQEFGCAASSIAVHLIEKDDILALLETLPEPIDYRLPIEKFHDELMALTANASRMPYIALRELNDDKAELRCIAMYGFPDISKEDLDLIPLTDHPTFLKVITTGKPVVENSMGADHLSALRSIGFLGKVRSFVAVPIKVGAQLFGTLSFGAPCEYDYTTIEQNAFETIANAIGVSLTNWRNFRNAEASVFNEAKTSVAIGIVEVAQSSRHDVKNSLQAAQTRLKNIHEIAEGSTREDLKQIAKYSEAVSQELERALNSVEKIKVATKPPRRELAKVDLARTWGDAIDMVSGRLASNQIYCVIKGKAETLGYPEFLRHAFLHFLYNSIDAFIERGIKSNRRINVSIDAQGDAAKSILIRYTDNAGGIDPFKLQPPMPEDKGLANYIFEKEVTSKEGGSGYGMFLARRIIQVYHKGTVELTDFRGGVVFDIYLPKRDESELKSKV